MKALTLVQAFTSWISWRTKLEQRACEYWIGEDRKEIRRLELLVQASDLIDTIVKLLKAKGLSAQEVFERYAKIAKITVDEAKYVLNRPIISLRNLERPELQARIKAVTSNMKGLERRRDKPKPFMAEQLKNFKEFM
jgi:DNA gyrase/topoisomerase IV subunit A